MMWVLGNPQQLVSVFMRYCYDIVDAAMQSIYGPWINNSIFCQGQGGNMNGFEYKDDETISGYVNTKVD